MIKSETKRNTKSIAKKNRLKADFSKEVQSRKCDFCKSYMKYSRRCAVGNKPSSNYICYRFVLKAGYEEKYKDFLLNIKDQQGKKVKSKSKKK